MLVLSRKRMQSVVVGGDDIERMIRVTILQVRGGEVRLGFEGPVRVAVHRFEVWERIQTRAGPPDAPRPSSSRPAAGCRDGRISRVRTVKGT